VFLTGATGYIGSSVAEALLKAGHQVIGLARSRESAEKLTKRGIEAHPGDLRDRASLESAISRADGIIHAASPSDATSAELDNMLLDTVFAKLKGTRKPFIYTSGVWVLGDTAGRPADETFLLNPTPLVVWRAECEKRLFAAAATGFRGSIIRPAIVYGRGGGIPGSLVQSGLDKGTVVFVGDGENHWSGVHVTDLSNLYLLVLERAEGGSIFHGAQGDAVEVREVALAASEAAGKPGYIAPWPLVEARKTLGPYADALVLDQRISADKARKILGWEPKQASFLDDVRGGSYKVSAAS
jgi:nucleoside-diphosphate-sugar epimerase